MDGGLRSSANADLAIGYKAVLIISFRSSGPAGERIAARLALQTDQLKEAGTAIRVITPDELAWRQLGPIRWM
jgi:NTE family protein